MSYNPLKRKLAAGKSGAGVLITMPSVNMAQTLASCGFDYLFIDMEHGPIDLGTAHHLIAATAGTECAPLVRVPKPDVSLCKPLLDSGAMGMIFPMINTKELAEATVQAIRYPPLGQRGWGPFYAPMRWGIEDATEYYEAANRDILNVILIEHAEAVRNIDEILSVPGIDVANIAPMDLAVSMGFPGQRDHPEVLEAIRIAEEAIKKTDVVLGGMALSASEMNEKIERGYRFFVCGFDVMLVQQSAKAILDGTNR